MKAFKGFLMCVSLAFFPAPRPLFVGRPATEGPFGPFGPLGGRSGPPPGEKRGGEWGGYGPGGLRRPPEGPNLEGVKYGASSKEPKARRTT